MKALRFSPKSFWLSDPMLVALLVVLGLFIFLLPILPMPLWGVLTVHVLFSLYLLSGIVLLARNRVEFLAGAILGSAALVARAADLLIVEINLEPWNAALMALAQATLAFLILMHVFRDGPISSYRIAGAVAAYLLVGQVWVNLYALIGALRPGAFHFVSPPRNTFELTERLVYLSFSTLTTVGFGDVAAVHPAARSAAILEAVAGMLFPAILIARLVAMQIESRRGDKGSR